MKKYIWIFLAGLIFAVFCFLFFYLGRLKCKDSSSQIEIVRDTIIVKDTITIEKPIEKIRYKYKDTLISILDSFIVYQHDTAYISLPIEKVEYEEEDYKAIISGINPKLESISVYPKTIYITEKQKEIVKRHWTVNITVGPGILYNGKFNYGVGVVAGFGYSF